MMHIVHLPTNRPFGLWETPMPSPHFIVHPQLGALTPLQYRLLRFRAQITVTLEMPKPAVCDRTDEHAPEVVAA
jgi:hypothetical protein